MASTRSTTGCFACKSKRKKCDETKPHCLRCQKSRIECPGYTYVRDPTKPHGKPRTLQAPRAMAGRSQATMLQATPLTKFGEPGPQLQGWSTLEEDPMTSQASYSMPGTSVEGNVRKPAEDIHESNRLPSSSFNGLLPYSIIDFHTSDGLVVDTVNSAPVQTLSGTSAATPLTSGQASLLAALLSLGSALDATPEQGAHPSTNPNVPSVPIWAPRGTEKQVDVRSHKDLGPEGVTTFIRPELVLDRTAGSNALPFLLQGYAVWISRLALEPLKLMDIARDFVLGHFEDGDQSRWIIGLLANAGSRIATVEMMERSHQPMMSALHSAVWWQLEVVKSRPNPTKSELVKALDSALEVLAMYIYTNSSIQTITLSQAVAPIFRQLCPEPPGAPINLSSLLQHSLRSLRQYVGINLICSVLSDMPTLFRYQVAMSSSQPYNHHPSLPAIQEDGVIQWLYGIPNQLLLLFATMKTMNQDGLLPSEEMVASLERDIREVPPFTGSSSDRFLAVVRSVVQECWRQAALVYLYMGVCRDSSNTPRVKDAFKRLVRLLNGTRPGRLPDEFLTSPLMIISPAAQQRRDREIIRERAVRLHARASPTNDYIMRIIEDYWSRADAEGRPIMWSDIAVSRRQVLGV